MCWVIYLSTISPHRYASVLKIILKVLPLIKEELLLLIWRYCSDVTGTAIGWVTEPHKDPTVWLDVARPPPPESNYKFDKLMIQWTQPQ
jgi:hypothetical protein